MNHLPNKALDHIIACNSHIKRLISASSKMQEFMPIDSYKALSEEQIEHIDQFLFRFTKLQDTMGEKLFKLALQLSGEEVKSKTFIDILNRLEELEIVQTNEWLDLRNLRNNVAHEYPNQDTEIASNINAIYDSLGKIYQIFVQLKKLIINVGNFSSEQLDSEGMATPNLNKKSKNNNSYRDSL